MDHAAILRRALAGTIALLAGLHASAVTYNDFSSTAGLTLNGNAAQAGNALRVTPATYFQSGSAFSTSTVALSSLSSFSTRFQFQITENGDYGDNDGAGADGLVFVVQTVASNVGGAGGGIGYAGIASSVGIEFDTYDNGGIDDSDGNHVGIDLNGSVDSSALQAVGTRFNDGNVWTAWVDYNGATNALEVRANQSGVRPVASLLSYSVNLSTVLGVPDAYVGFTSGTGSGFGNHDILNWTFASEYRPIGDVGSHPAGVPDSSSTLPLLGLALAGLVFSKRRLGR